MHYDPIKRSLGGVFNRTPFLRKLFYFLLDVLLLRSWHIRSELRKLNGNAVKSILDAGSGFGQYSFWMTKKFDQAEILAVDVKEEQMVEDGEKYLVVDGCGGGWEFDVKSSDEEKMNDDILEL